ETYKKRIETFGWNVLEIKNGHNIEEIKKIFAKANTLNTVHTQKPTMILARTVKGKGVPFLEDKPGWHGKAVPKDRLQEALKAIGSYDKKVMGIIASAPLFDTEMQSKTADVLKKLNNFIGGTSKGHPAARTKLQPAGIGGFGALTGEITSDRIYEVNVPIATREAFGDALADLGKSNPQVVALDAEVGNSTYTERLKETNPTHFFQMFIDEENMVSVGLGLSKMGYIPYISTFAAFLTRAYDQMRMAQYSKPTLNIVGSHAGCSIGQDGISQMALEDISMMRSLRESTVLYPADAISAYKLTKEMTLRKGVNYLRTTREKTPILYKNNEQFPIGGCKIHSLKNKKSIALIISAGITLYESLKAQKILEKNQIYTTVIDLYSVKPLDSKTIQHFAKQVKQIIVVEDHYEAGGIGEAVITSCKELNVDVTFTHLCVRKEPRSGTPEELLCFEEIDAEAIVKSIIK
ncbi:MAG: transketolase, partial [Candidatus Roizmanbacteria bacterium]|nr:transketolase [Candidatus Roizmanbacteria bacterium]